MRIRLKQFTKKLCMKGFNIMKKSLFRRFVCLMAVMLMAVSMVAPAAAYNDEEVEPRYVVVEGICENCHAIMGFRTQDLGTTTGICAYNGTHEVTSTRMYGTCDYCGHYNNIIVKSFSCGHH